MFLKSSFFQDTDRGDPSLDSFGNWNSLALDIGIQHTLNIGIQLTLDIRIQLTLIYCFLPFLFG